MRKLIIYILIFVCLKVHAQSGPGNKRLEYFERYRDLAMEEMNRSGVPASITLAQGALESGDGTSRLALQANNHFGIKCHDDWNGKTMKHDDDRKNECFRKYGSVEESYRDHSDFLNDKSRYASLFELDPTDYKGWARGLKKAGYATSPTYDKTLIRIIEEYDLLQYDLLVMNHIHYRSKPDASPVPVSGRRIMENNRVKYIIAKAGDSFLSLSSELDKLEWELPRYNDLTPYDSIVEGQIIYVQPKRNKAGVGNKIHTIKTGESMYEVSQLYAVKLVRLYDLNQIPYGTEPETGSVLQLRKAKKKKISEKTLNDPIIEDEGDSQLEFDLGL